MISGRARAAIVSGAALALVACAAATGAPPVTPADAGRASQRWPGTDQAQLEAGRALYVERCSSCHVPPAPTSVPADRWPGEVAEMKERAGLSDDEARLVERYLITVASRTP
jgi:hypothetical protein